MKLRFILLFCSFLDKASHALFLVYNWAQKKSDLPAEEKYLNEDMYIIKKTGHFFS